MFFEGLGEVAGHDAHGDFELFIKDLFTIIVNSQFVIDVPLMKEVAVLDVRALVFFQEVGAVLGCAVRHLHGPFGEAMVVEGLG